MGLRRGQVPARHRGGLRLAVRVGEVPVHLGRGHPGGDDPPGTGEAGAGLAGVPSLAGPRLRQGDGQEGVEGREDHVLLRRAGGQGVRGGLRREVCRDLHPPVGWPLHRSEVGEGQRAPHLVERGEAPPHGRLRPERHEEEVQRLLQALVLG